MIVIATADPRHRAVSETRLCNSARPHCDFRARWKITSDYDVELLDALSLKGLNQGPPNGGDSKQGGFPISTCPSRFILFFSSLSQTHQASHNQRASQKLAPGPQQDTKECPKHRSFPGVRTDSEGGGIKGKAKRAKGVREGTRPEGKDLGTIREKGWKERGPKAHSKNSNFCTPLI